MVQEGVAAQRGPPPAEVGPALCLEDGQSTRAPAELPSSFQQPSREDLRISPRVNAEETEAQREKDGTQVLRLECGRAGRVLSSDSGAEFILLPKGGDTAQMPRTPPARPRVGRARLCPEPPPRPWRECLNRSPGFTSHEQDESGQATSSSSASVSAFAKWEC